MSARIVSTIPEITQEHKERFLSYISKDDQSGRGCWLWRGVSGAGGYGRFYVGGRGYAAHRVSYVIEHGQQPGEKLVCHKCDVEICVNPDHLFLGSNRDNADDMLTKGRAACGNRNGSRLHPERLRRGANHPFVIDPSRAARGVNHGNAMFTDADIVAIRDAYDSGTTTHKALARKYGVGKSTIARVVRRQYWKHVPESVTESALPDSRQTPPQSDVQISAPCIPCG